MEKPQLSGCAANSRTSKKAPATSTRCPGPSRPTSRRKAARRSLPTIKPSAEAEAEGEAEAEAEEAGKLKEVAKLQHQPPQVMPEERQKKQIPRQALPVPVPGTTT